MARDLDALLHRADQLENAFARAADVIEGWNTHTEAEARAAIQGLRAMRSEVAEVVAKLDAVADSLSEDEDMNRMPTLWMRDAVEAIDGTIAEGERMLRDGDFQKSLRRAPGAHMVYR